jgi:hypothetical protein
LAISRNKYTDYEWYQGNLGWLLRPNGQTWIRNFILERWRGEASADPLVVNAHRRLGKSFLNVLMAVEICIRWPGMFVQYTCGEKEQVREIVEPLFFQILETCPPDLYPKSRGFTFRFQNPAWERKGAVSRFKLVGANYKNGDMGRGSACDAAFLDEVRDFKKLQYFVQAVLTHQFQGRSKPLLVITSTVPWTIDHDFSRPITGYIPQAISRGRYIVVPGSKNPDFTERDKKIVLSTIPGGEKDPAYQREVECELIGDVGRLITPEYQGARERLAVGSYKRPEVFIPLVCLDSGFVDHTAVLFGYIDWLPQILVFEAEIFRKHMTTKEIAEAVKAMLKRLGYDKSPFYRPNFLADIEPRGLQDLRRDFGLGFKPVTKFNAESALTAFRSRIQSGQIRVVVPGCPQLDYQLLHGIHKLTADGAKSKDFERSETMGHWDCGSAAVYLNRMAPWQFNPYPKNHKSHLSLLSAGTKVEPDGSWGGVLNKALGRR